MALSPYYSVFDPFTSLASLPDPFDVFSPGFGFPTTSTGRGRALATDYPMDVKETEKSFEVYADAPGMTPEDIHVDFNDDTRVLTIRGQHTESSETGDDVGTRRVYRSERIRRSFVRSFTLPRDLEADQINANLDRGVLNVHIPKKVIERPPPRKIAVGGSGGGSRKIEASHTTDTTEEEKVKEPTTAGAEA